MSKFEVSAQTVAYHTKKVGKVDDVTTTFFDCIASLEALSKCDDPIARACLGVSSEGRRESFPRITKGFKISTHRTGPPAPPPRRRHHPTDGRKPSVHVARVAIANGLTLPRHDPSGLLQPVLHGSGQPIHTIPNGRAGLLEPAIRSLGVERLVWLSIAVPDEGLRITSFLGELPVKVQQRGANRSEAANRLAQRNRMGVRSPLEIIE